MPGIPTSEFGLVSRSLPQPTVDGQERECRLARSGSTMVEPVFAKNYGICDEGSYFVANNSGTGVATVAAPTSFSDTAPFFTIANIDTAQNASSKRVYLDYIRAYETAAGTAGTDFRIQLVLDYTVPSAGTLLTSTSTNTDTPKSSSIAQARILPTGIAQTGNSRTVVGTMIVLPAVTAPIAALCEFYLNFGGIDQGWQNYTQSTTAAAQINKYGYPMPPIIIGPGAMMMIRFLITSQSAASSWTVEAGWWER